MADVYVIFREAAVASGAAHLVGAYTDRQAALDDIPERDRQDPATSGRYSLAKFEIQPDDLIPLSGVMQEQIDLARFQLSFAFGAGSTPGFTSTSSVFEMAAPFPYPGNNNIVNPPTKLTCFASMNQDNKSGEIRIYDTTNGVEVGSTEFLGNTNIEKQQVTMSGLPNEEADLEIQIRRITSGGAVTLFSATIF